MLTEQDIYGVVLAGGSGTRLWPLSREGQPKHLLVLQGRESLLQQTVGRLLDIIPTERILVVTHGNQASAVSHQLNKISPFSRDNILTEPEPRNTLPAILWAVKAIAESSPDAVVAIFPSDHLVKGNEAFRQDMKLAADAARNNFIVTFGLKPSFPETGFGYIYAREPMEGGLLRVESFLEKPEKSTAEKMLKEGNHFWNSGMFAFKASCFLEEVKNLQPNLWKLSENLGKRSTTDEIAEIYRRLPSLSIDVGIMEKSKKVAVLPATFGWSDLGTWDAVYQILEKDADGNASQGSVSAEDTTSSLLLTSQGRLAAIGLKDMVVVKTGENVLVCPRDRVQDVKKVVEKMPPEDDSSTVHRPWGKYTVFDEKPGYKLKRIVVTPGQKLSLQRHNHRAEHWVVVEGIAKVTNADKEIILHKNESTYIPIGQIHRLENAGPNPLVIIEVQTGDYVGEDDIERFDDIYGRTTKHSKKF